jgi:hypothetical protein
LIFKAAPDAIGDSVRGKFETQDGSIEVTATLRSVSDRTDDDGEQWDIFTFDLEANGSIVGKAEIEHSEAHVGGYFRASIDDTAIEVDISHYESMGL